MKEIQEHFSHIADQYKNLRTSDLEPVLYISKQFDGLPSIQAADIGCGTGRYDLLLFQHLRDKLYLHCVDNNKEMLEQLNSYLKQNKIENFKATCCLARNLPFDDECLDSMLSFNAIHHFKIRDFLSEVLRILKDGGYLFVYTRTRTQNNRNIWGKFFPLWNEKERRLYEVDEFRDILREYPKLKIKKEVLFTYERASSLKSLLKQVRGHHYSTFCFYHEEEFKESLDQFIENIKENFQALNRITWYDENILYVIRKQKD